MEGKKWEVDIDNLDKADGLEDSAYQDFKDALLYVIEVNEYMVTKEKDENSPLYTVLNSAYDSIVDRMVSAPADAVGILLFGRLFNGASKDEGCKVLLDLGIPKVEAVKNLRESAEDLFKDFSQHESSEDTVPLADVLFLANQQFSHSAANYLSRRVFFVTSNDRPELSQAGKTAAITRAKDLGNMGVTFLPFFISGNTQFDSSIFYEDLLYAMPTIEWGEDALSSHSAADINNLKHTINSLNSPKRAILTNFIELSPKILIGVKAYKLFASQSPAKMASICRVQDKLEFVDRRTLAVAVETGKTLEPDEVRRTFKFGSNYIPFMSEQIQQIRYMDLPAIRVIGFKKAEALDWQFNISSSYFLYPTEENYTGSVRSFTALVRSLWSKGKVALVWTVLRRNSSARMAILVPELHQPASVSGNIPQGLFLIPLPFVDDLRDPPGYDINRAPDSLIDAMTSIVKKLSMPIGYKPERYSNPSLQWFYKVIQAVALEEELPEVPEDSTLPKFKSINTRTGSVISLWNDLLQKLSAPPALKRTTEEVKEGPRSKQNKNDSHTGLKEAFENDNLNKLTVNVLSSFLRDNGVSISGLRKPQLIELVKEHYKAI